MYLCTYMLDEIISGEILQNWQHYCLFEMGSSQIFCTFCFLSFRLFQNILTFQIFLFIVKNFLIRQCLGQFQILLLSSFFPRNFCFTLSTCSLMLSNFNVSRWLTLALLDSAQLYRIFNKVNYCPNPFGVFNTQGTFEICTLHNLICQKKLSYLYKNKTFFYLRFLFLLLVLIHYIPHSHHISAMQVCERGINFHRKKCEFINLPKAVGKFQTLLLTF